MSPSAVGAKQTHEEFAFLFLSIMCTTQKARMRLFRIAAWLTAFFGPQLRRGLRGSAKTLLLAWIRHNSTRPLGKLITKFEGKRRRGKRTG